MLELKGSCPNFYNSLWICIYLFKKGFYISNIELNMYAA